MRVAGKGLELELREAEVGRQQIRISDSEQSGLFIDFCDQDYVLHFDQRPDGRVRLLSVYDDQSIVVSAASFAELYRRHPDVIEVSFFPLLDHLGVLMPPTRFEPAITQLVVKRLGQTAESSEEEFRRLLQKMDSPSYDVRDAATRELQENVGRYAKFVQEAYQLSDVSLEVKTRLKRVLQTHKSEDSLMDGLIAGMQLLDDPAYLTNLLTRIEPSDRTPVVSRLEQLSGESLGPDPEAWQKWLLESTE